MLRGRKKKMYTEGLGAENNQKFWKRKPGAEDGRFDCHLEENNFSRVVGGHLYTVSGEWQRVRM